MRAVAMSTRVKFLVDSMLGSLARWLRLLGYDTIYAKNWPDGRILKVAEREERSLVTRDKGLYRSTIKKGIKAIVVSSEVVKSLAILSYSIGIDLRIDHSRTRCPLCNSQLRSISRHLVKDRVPSIVYENYRDFWECPVCGQIYWIGGHWRGIKESLEEARKLAEKYKRRSEIEGFSTTKS